MMTGRDMRARIAIIEDDPVVRSGLEGYFGDLPEYSEALTFGSVEEFFEKEPGARFDVVLTDIGLPGKSGIEGIRMIKEQNPATDVIMITVFKDADKIFDSLCAGATGYILKGASFAEIRENVLIILKGGSYMSPAIARKIVEYFNPAHVPETNGLTGKEEEVVRGLVDGLSYKLIAARLCISIDTVRYHIKNIYSKLQVNSKSQVIARFLKGNSRK